MDASKSREYREDTPVSVKLQVQHGSLGQHKFSCRAAPTAVLGALNGATISVQRCRSSLLLTLPPKEFQLTTPLYTTATNAQHSLSRSSVHACLRTLLVLGIEIVPGPSLFRFLDTSA